MLHKELCEAFEAQFYKNTQYYAEMLSVYNQDKDIYIEGDDYEIPLKDYFMQLFVRDKAGIGEQVICALLWQWILNDKLLYQVYGSPECFTDKEIQKNDALVKSYVDQMWKPGIKEAVFWGGTQGADGKLVFEAAPLKEKTYFPLEVGFCKSTQFFHNLLISGAVARLPYNRKHLLIFEYHDLDELRGL
jgi:hypothetical protein